MQIVTTEMLLDLYRQIGETTNLMLEVFINAAWSNLIEALAMVLSSTLSQDWSGLVTGLLMAVGSIILLYRIIRQNLLSVVEISISKFD